jgi:hypothetical protein
MWILALLLLSVITVIELERRWGRDEGGRVKEKILHLSTAFIWDEGGRMKDEAADVATPVAASLFTPSPVAERSGLASLHPSSFILPPLAERLAASPMPPRDFVALVNGLRQGAAVPRVVREQALPTPLGAQEPFWIVDSETARTYQVTATLRLQGQHVQMWVQSDAAVPQEALQRSAQAFEQRIYPTNHRYFGSEWTPGVDGDPRLVVLNAHINGVAGYFASANQYARQINPYSNEREMFVMNLSALTPGTVGYDAVLAHEFQHMIQWHQDSNEDAWLNEGLSELAEEVNGYDGWQTAVSRYEQQPDIQLNAWSDDAAEVAAHYGASFLFVRYFLDGYGPEMLRELAQAPANGSAAFTYVLTRNQTSMTFDDLFADWLVANTLDDPTLADGRYGYPKINVRVKNQEEARHYPFTLTQQVHQYGADYLALYPPAGGSAVRVTFAGSPTVKLVPNEPTSGRFQWWSNRGDASHSTLEHRFDLRGVTTATLSYNVWYDIENGWDYALVRASTDGGASWQLLRGQFATDANPLGNALGPGYTGKSGQREHGPPVWLYEEVSLGAFCGQVVTIRFDYITDDAVNKAGLCLDDVAIKAIGFYDDMESGDGEWHAEGFIRHENILPQRYLVQSIEHTPTPRVRRWPVGSDGRGQWVFEGLGAEMPRITLIIAALAPGTTERAGYRLVVDKLP